MLMFIENDRMSWQTLFHQFDYLSSLSFIKEHYKNIPHSNINLSNLSIKFMNNIYYYFYHARTVSGIFDYFNLYKYAL